MKYKSILIAFIISFILIGCTTNKNLSIQEQIELNKNSKASKTHIFENRTKLEVLEALRKVLLYSDGDDFKVTYFEDKIKIERRTFFYYLLNYDTMDFLIDIDTKESGNNIILTSSASYNTSVAIGSSSYKIIDSISFYNLFYERIEYVLNINNSNNPYKWQTCDEAKKILADKEDLPAIQNLFPLCAFSDDLTPDEYNSKQKSLK